MGGVFGGGDPYRDQQQQQMTQGDYPMVTADWVPPAVGSDFYAPGGQGGYPTGAFDSAAYGTGGDYGGGSDSGGGGILNWLGSERGQRAMQQLGGFSAGLLQGSAPSLQPRNFSTGLGAGMAGMQQAGSQYYQDALHRAQAQQAQAQVANTNIWNATMQREAANATGLPPGYMPGAPGSGGGMPPVQAPASAGGGGAPAGDFATYAPLIQKYESAGRPYVGYGGTDLSKAPLSDTGFPQWGGNMGPAGNSTAAGLYQITKSTWDPIARDLGIKDFSPESQNRVAEALYAQRGLDPWLPYNKNLSAAIGRGEAPNPFGQAPPRGANLASSGPAAVPPPSPIQSTGTVDPTPPVGGLAARFPGVAAARPGLLPTPAPAPAIATAPAAAPARTAVAPAATTSGEQPATTGSSAPAATARVASAGAPTLTEGDSIAYGFKKFGGLQGNPVGGRNPQQVLDNIDANLKRDPDYYRGKTVLLSTGVMNKQDGKVRIDLVPEEIRRIQDKGGGKVILAGVDTGEFAGHNNTLAQMAADAGVPFAGPLPTNDVHPGPDGYRQYLARVQRGVARLTGVEGSGSSFGPGTITPPDPGAGDGGTPAVAPAGTTAAPPAPPPPITAGPMSTPVAAAPAAPIARPGGPMSLPGGVPYGAPPSAPPAPSPGAATAPPGAPPVSPAAATAGPAGPNAMPGAIAPPPVAPPPQPLPMPNLGAVQPPGAGGLPPYDVAAARRAQILSIAGAATGHQVPAYLAEQAGLPNKAVQQQWDMQKQLYGAQLQAAQSQWNAASELQKQQIAHQYGLDTEQYKSELGIRAERFKQGIMVGPDGQIIPQPGYAPATAAIAGATAQAQKNAEALAEFDRPREYKGTDDNGKPFTYIATPRQMGAAPPASLGAPPAPAGAPAGTPGTAGGYQSGIAPGRQEELTGTGKRLTTYADAVHNDAETAVAGRADLEFLSALGPRIALPGPMASAMQSFNRVRQSIFGNAVEPVASYEMAQQLMGGMMRTALRQSDPNPTERQQAMMLASMPTPASSAEGFQDGIRHMQGIADYKVFKRDALNAWMTDPAHNGSAAGFESSFRLSAIPFVLDRMSEQQQAKYIETLKAKDPRALERLRDQITAVKELNYTYRY